MGTRQKCVLGLPPSTESRATMGGKEIAVLATRLTGTERERISWMFADYAANYDAYRGRKR